MVVSSHRGIGNIGGNPGRYTGNPCSRFDPLRRHSRGGSFDHPATSGVFPSCTDRLLRRLAPDGESDFLKDRWLPGTCGSCRSAWNAEGDGRQTVGSPGSSLTRARRSGATRPEVAAAAEVLEVRLRPVATEYSVCLLVSCERQTGPDDHRSRPSLLTLNGPAGSKSHFDR